MKLTNKKLALSAVLSIALVVSILTIATPLFDSLKLKAEATTCNPKADLVGDVLADGKATITNKSATCSYKVGVASYYMYNNNLHDQKIFDSRTATIGPKKTMSFDINIPSCAYQFDLFYGDVITDYRNTQYGERRIDSRTNRENRPFCPLPTQPLKVTCAASKSTVKLGESVTFTANPTGGNNKYTYSWVLTGGTTGSSKSISKIFESAGSKSGKVTVTSNGKTATAECRINVTPPPVQNPDLKVTCAANKSSVKLGESVTFTANPTGGNNAYSYSWVLTGGTTAASKTVTKTFESVGSKSAKVTVTSNGKSATAECRINVTQEQTNNLGGTCAVTDSSITKGDSVTFTGNGTGGTGTYSYSWSGTDELSSNSKTVSKQYNSTGTKTATVRITSGNQFVDRQCTVNVQDVTNNDFNVSCEASDSNIEEGDSVSYTANATGGNGGYTYSWSGTDGLSSNSKTVSKSYNSEGTKNATVVVTANNGQSKSAQCTVDVDNEESNNDDEDLDVSCKANKRHVGIGESVRFTATARDGGGDYEYEWSGSENIDGDDRSITVEFDRVGEKTARVTVESDNGDRETARCTVDVDEDTYIPTTTDEVPPDYPTDDYVYLSQVPYTGIGSTAKLVLFVLALLAWSGFVSYMVIRNKARKNLLKAYALENAIEKAEVKAKPYMNPAAAAVFNRVNRTA